jgi:hypothetical protein
LKGLEDQLYDDAKPIGQVFKDEMLPYVMSFPQVEGGRKG